MFDPYHKWLGIPRDQRPPTHYQLLGVSPAEDDPEVIDEAAIRQSAHVRTYQNGPQAQECSRLLNEIALARATLLDPLRRQAYDAGLRIDKDEPPDHPEIEEEPWDLLGDLAVAAPPRVGATRRSRRARTRGIRMHNLVIFVVLNAISLALLVWFLSFWTSEPPKHRPPPTPRIERQTRKSASTVKPRGDLRRATPRNGPARVHAGSDSRRDPEEKHAAEEEESGNPP